MLRNECNRHEHVLLEDRGRASALARIGCSMVPTDRSCAMDYLPSCIANVVAELVTIDSVEHSPAWDIRKELLSR